MKILIRNHRTEKWQLVQSAAYQGEVELQNLIAEEPSLISINEVREGAGTLVVAIREFPLDIGSIDLVGFTAKGDIAVIECKLAANEEIKRKVIGQVFEYGAGIWGMSYETLDEKVFLRTQKNLAVLIQEAITDPTWDEEEFRTNVSVALQSGDFILIIVVDEISEELSKIVRFINDAGKPAFSLAALEMRRFHHGESEMLIPHVFGSTKPKTEVRPRNRKKWDENSFFEGLAQQSPAGVEPARKILEWVTNPGQVTRISWGEGEINGSFVPVVEHKGKDNPLFAVYTYGSLELYFQWYQYKKPFDSENKRIELLDRLNKIKGIDLPKDAINRRPSIRLEVFADSEARREFLEVFEWMIEQIKET